MKSEAGASRARGLAPAAEATAPPRDALLYLYAILPEGSAADALLDGAGIPGVHPEWRLFAVRAAGLVAAVSYVPAGMFHEESLNALLQDVGKIGPYALRHNEAVGALLQEAGAVIPLSFGAVYTGTAGVIGLLEGNAEAFHRQLEALAGKAEWTVKVFVDPQAAVKAAEESSAEGRRLQEEADAATPGRAYMLRKRREEVLGRDAARVQKESVEAVLAAVQKSAESMRVDDLPPQEASGRQLALKASALVENGRVGDLQAALRSFHGHSGIEIELTGPWPAYSFIGGSRGGS